MRNVKRFFWFFLLALLLGFLAPRWGAMEELQLRRVRTPFLLSNYSKISATAWSSATSPSRLTIESRCCKARLRPIAKRWMPST
jgi:hypothetical protein